MHDHLGTAQTPDLLPNLAPVTRPFSAIAHTGWGTIFAGPL